MFVVDEETNTTVGGLHLLNSLVSQPHISQTSTWGELNKAITGPKHKKEFLDYFMGYVHFLRRKLKLSDGML